MNPSTASTKNTLASVPEGPREAQGLSSTAAAQRLTSDGPNELPGQSSRGLVKIAREVLSEPMFLLLIAAATIYVVLGEAREAAVLAASIVVVVLITIYQERRTENALAKLRDLSSPRAVVIRDGVEQRVASRDVVVGDCLILREGDRIAADAVLQSAGALSVDESILTGESLPVDKVALSVEATLQSHVYSGSLVVRGFGAAQVTATGARSEIGKIGGALQTLVTETTALYREVRRIVRWVAIAALVICALITFIYALSRHNLLGGVLAGITVAMGLVPEEFPVVLTIFLAMGAWRISSVGVLTRRMPAIESMGAVTVLAVDKTGTLTENKMKVAVLESLYSAVDLRQPSPQLDAATEEILSIALAASERDAFDPMERAIQEAAANHSPHHIARLSTMQLTHEYDLTPELLAVTHVWRKHEHVLTEVTVKGAPETIFDLCKVASDQRAQLMERIAVHARDGLRVLAVAKGSHPIDSLPATPYGFSLQLLGLICFADPLRKEVPSSLKECYAAGIRVVMITGDHPGTALAIASQAGFDTTSGVMTGAQIEAMDAEQLRIAVRTVNLFARTKPEHKLRLVQALKANGEVVAMTGDGVNDAPALKAAHIGVAMGLRGTDVAREAAALVLVNDDFASLVSAVRLGRRIYANIRHAMTFILAVHVPIAGLGLLPVLFGWPLIFFPMHVLFLEFVIDPACALVFEADPESRDLMQRKPRQPDAKLFSAAMIRRALLLGSVVLVAELLIYSAALVLYSEAQARTLAFTGLVIANLTLIFVSRSRSEDFAAIYSRSNRVFWWVVGSALMALATAVYLPALASLFAFANPPPLAIMTITTLSAGAVLLSGRLSRIDP